MKKFNSPRMRDLQKLAVILAARASGTHARFFSVNSVALAQAWSTYLLRRENSTLIAPDTVPWIGMKNTFLNLYSSASKGVDRKYVPAIRKRFNRDSYIICPYCGRASFDSLDHYLPKSRYPEYALLSKNLVPSCDTCNELKDNIVPSGKDDFFIHPYYDKGLSDQLIYFEIFPPYNVATISLQIMPGLPSRLNNRLSFQINNLNLTTRLKYEALKEIRALIDHLDKKLISSQASLNQYLQWACSTQYSKYESKNTPGYVIHQSILSDFAYLNYLYNHYQLP